jgi:ParB-like chromosome segregation protein Spo0J
VAGERRWQAARLAGLSTVPVIVRELNDQSALAALIEFAARGFEPDRSSALDVLAIGSSI